MKTVFHWNKYENHGINMNSIYLCVCMDHNQSYHALWLLVFVCWLDVSVDALLLVMHNISGSELHKKIVFKD